MIGPQIRALSTVWVALCASHAAGCGASTPAAEGPVATTSQGVFQDKDVIAYIVRDPAGRVIGRLHCRFERQDGLRVVVSRAAYGRPAVDLERLEAERTVERVTVLTNDTSVRRLKVLSSEDGLNVYRYENGSVFRTSRTRTERFADPNAAALPLHPDDPAVLALFFEASGMEPGDGRRVFVRSEDPVRIEPWLVQVFAVGRRDIVVRLPWGQARLDQRRRIERLTLNTGVVYERLREAGGPPALIQAPEPLAYTQPPGARWRDRPVRIDVEGGRLAGVLSDPVDRGAQGAPGVVFFSDLGPQNRHGFGRGVDAGTWAILDHLASEGFAVLRLDDRGTGASHSAVAPRDVRPKLANDDARRIVAFMRRQPEVDPERLFVMAHGFGAYEAVSVLGEHGPGREVETYRGLVLLAPPARGPVAVLGERWAKVQGGQAAQRQRELTEVFRAAAGQSQSPLTAPIAMMRRYAGEVGKLQNWPPLLEAEFPLMPIVVVQGMKDFEVSWRADAKALVDRINGRRGKHARLQVYEDVDHLMKYEPRQSTPARYRMKTRRIEPRVLRALSAWMKSQLGPPRR